jgi:hypothetical protein
METKNHNFPGISHRFDVQIGSRGRTSSISTKNRLDGDTLTSIYDQGELPIELTRVPFAFRREGGNVRIESQSAAGIEKLADKLRNRGLEVK